jgi:endonuclease-3 related protein
VSAPNHLRQSTAAQLRDFYIALTTAYGPQHWWPSESAIETVVGAYLTQNTSWRNVERSIAKLKAAGVLSTEGLRAVPQAELFELIRPSGYMARKGAAIKAFIALLDERFNGSLDQFATANVAESRVALLALPGVGPETADAILLYALAQPAMVVDEYLRRIVTRHGLLHEKARYAEIQQLAIEAFAEEAIQPAALLNHYNEFHALVVMVGKTHCGGKPRCTGCPLNQPGFSPPVLVDISVPHTAGALGR